MNYIAIDPGVGTGLATLIQGTFRSWELFDLSEVAWAVNDVKRRRPNVVIITEKFIISKRTITTKVYYESLYFNGWLSIEYPGRIEQTAAQGKSFSTDDKLKHLGWYTPTKDGHANDAARHLLYRAVKNHEPHVMTKLEELIDE